MRPQPMFIRFQSAVPNSRGTHPGVFALANGPATDGLLTPSDHTWWAATNTLSEKLYPDPSHTDPACYDHTLNPGARAWFKASASTPLSWTEAYLDLLDRYGVRRHEIRSDTPGHLVYEDDGQVVPVPFWHPEAWPFD